MLTRTLIITIATSVLVICGSGDGWAQAFPSKPVRILTGEPGGGNDVASRLIAQGLSIQFGQPVIVENRPDVHAVELVAKAAPDGYTMLFASGPTWLGPMMQKMSYDALKDLAPVTWATSSPMVLVVNPALPVKSLKDLIALAKAEPGKLNYASTGTGGNPHLAAELFKSMAGVNMVRVPFKGGGPGVNAVLAGEVQVMFMTAGGVTNYIKSGRLRALGIANAQPSTLVPDLPTIASSGLPGYESMQMSGVFAPTGTPGPLINQLSQEIARVLMKPEVKEKLASIGLEVIGSSPKEFADVIKADMTRMGKVIKEAGIRAD
jgi:tripartite-type tricarboxylate transporter receptor subunit TctC